MLKNRLFILFTLFALFFSFGGLTMAQEEEPSTLYIGWPYQVPPDGHFNSFASGVINLGFYQDLMEPPVAVYMWADGVYEGMLAESFGYDEDNNYVITLKDGVMWSDGSEVSAQDLISTYYTGYLIGSPVWNDVASIEAVDDLTVRMVMKAPSQVAERRILTQNVRPASVYSSFAERAMPLVEAGAVAGDAEYDALVTELTAFRPEEYVAAGPYVLQPDSITDANVTLVKNEGGLNSDVVRFDQVVLWNGETEAVTPLVSSGELWYGTYGFPAASEAAFVEQGLDIIRGPSYNGPAIYVNHSVAPLDQVEVRQAMALAIDREQNGFVSLGESGIPNDCMCGFSDNLTELWLSEETLDSLNPYDYDPEAAAALLEGAGFTRGDDGVWADAEGNRLAFELIFPSDFLDWAAAAENVTQQLNEFGFEITARGVLSQQQQQDVYDSNFELAIRNWGVGSPFPGQSFLEPYNRYNGQGELAGEGVGGGMRFPLDVTFSGGDINVYDVALESGEGLDTEAQSELITQLAVSYNELLPAIPLWERYGNNPLNREFIEAPEGDDPIYQNAGLDHFMPYLIMTGGVGPAGE